MPCRIIKHKETGEEFVLPDCYNVANHWHLDMPNRDLIKEYCTCIRARKEKYETKTRDEVFSIIEELERRVTNYKEKIEKLEEDIEGLKTEVFLLNTIEVI